jgi:adenylate cyclase
VSRLTGILAGFQYAAITYYGFNYVTVAESYMPSTPENAHYVRSLVIVLCGWAAAFVSGELKKRIKTAFETQQAKNELELLFGQHVSKEVSKALIEGKGATKRLEATVMFLDIRNFTSFADSHSADEVVDYQNKFFGPIIDIINQHQGVVLQILCDGLMACFGTPVPNMLHADMAFQAGLKIIKHTRHDSEKGTIHPTSIGIGLHSGEMIAGNIGNEQRKQFSISGTPVIVASRIEQLNKKYQTEFLISDEVYQRITPGKTSIHFIGEEILKGIEKPAKIYQIVTQDHSG